MRTTVRVRVMRSVYPPDVKHPGEPRKGFNSWALHIKEQIMKTQYPEKGGRK